MLQLTILDSTKTGKKTEYQEYRYVKTNDFGSMLFKVGINPFTVKTGDFKNVNWKNGNKKLKVEIATENNGNFDIDLGELSFATVPFAYSADNVSYINPENAQDGDVLIYNSTTNMFEAKGISFQADWNTLLNKPTLFDGTWTSLTAKPTYATVATSGSYNDLTNAPTIPTDLKQLKTDAGNKVITNVANPVNAQDAVTKAYFDAAILKLKNELNPMPFEGLLAFYPFNSNANDVSGNNNNGTVNGATLSTDRKGNANSAYYFDGNDNITLNQKFLDGAFTLSLWIKVTETQPGSGGAIFSNGVIHGNWGDGFSSAIAPDNTYFSFEKNTTNIGFSFSNSTNPLNLNDTYFHHLTYTWDGLSGANSAKFYIDGNLVASIACASATINASMNLMFGYGSDGGFDYPYKGIIDDVRIYNRVLTGQEITKLFNE